MLELLLLFIFLRRLGKMMKRKGRRSLGYQALLVFLWFGFEFGGFFLATLYIEETGAYVVALAGALVGALIAFQVARTRKPLREPPED